MRYCGLLSGNPYEFAVLNMLIGVDKLIFGVIIESTSIGTKDQNLTRSGNKVRQWVNHVAQEVCYEFGEQFHSPRSLCNVSLIRVDEVPLV